MTWNDSPAREEQAPAEDTFVIIVYLGFFVIVSLNTFQTHNPLLQLLSVSCFLYCAFSGNRVVGDGYGMLRVVQWESTL